MDPDLERERHEARSERHRHSRNFLSVLVLSEVVNFFKAHKISTAVAAHFTNAGCRAETVYEQPLK